MHIDIFFFKWKVFVIILFHSKFINMSPNQDHFRHKKGDSKLDLGPNWYIWHMLGTKIHHFIYEGLKDDNTQMWGPICAVILEEFYAITFDPWKSASF